MSTNQKAISNGKINYLSVSSITKFDPREQGGCHRRWWYRYVAGIPEPMNAAFADGQAFHGEIEHYLTTGEDTLGPITRAGKQFLPTPFSVDVEVDLSWLKPRLTLADVMIEGRIDAINRSNVFLNSQGEASEQDPKTIEVIDWKSTSDLRYAKYGENLATVQMLGYAEAMRLTHNPDRVRLSQVFFQKRGKRAAIKNSIVLDVEDIRDRWQSYEQIANEMKHTATIQNAEEVEPSLNACSAFNGCPYKSFCPLSKTEKLTQIFGGTMGLLDTLKGNKKPVTQAPAPVATPTPAPKANIAEEVKKLEAEEKAIAAFAPVALGTCPNCAEEVTHENGSCTPSGRVVHTTCTKANPILPPDAPASEPPKSAQAIPASANVSDEIKEIASPWGEVPAPVVDTRATLPKEEIATPKKSRTTKKTEDKVEPVSWDNGLQLFVDCVVEGVPTKSLDAYIEGLHETIRKQFGVQDLRNALDNKCPLAYGGWKGILSSLAKLDPPLSAAYSVFDVRESEIKQVVIEALKPLCSVFARGVK